MMVKNSVGVFYFNSLLLAMSIAIVANTETWVPTLSNFLHLCRIIGFATRVGVLL